MKRVRLVSWNVNGIRAAYKKDFLTWFKSAQPSILCLQETKASEEQIPEELKHIAGYRVYYVSAKKKGYSGVGLYTSRRPIGISKGIGINRFDIEGRVMIAEYEAFLLYNVYFPNGKMSTERLRYKLAFYRAFLAHVAELRRAGKKIVICGDVNTAHKEIDLARPKENQRVSGFLPEERAWIDKLLEHGFIDTFRVFSKDGGQYTWWDLKTRARERNVGWRIDYFFISENLRKHLKAAFIMKDVMGSDHCPIGIDMAL